MKYVTEGRKVGGCFVQYGGRTAACRMYAKSTTVSSKGYNGWPRTPDGRGTGCISVGRFCYFRDPAYRLSSSLVESFCTNDATANAVAQVKHAIRSGACKLPFPPTRLTCARGQPGCICIDKCTRSSQCPTGIVCRGGKCSRERGLHQRCFDPWWVCKPGLYCGKGRCRQYLGPNRFCGYPWAKCSSGLTCSATTKRCVKVVKKYAKCNKAYEVCPGAQKCILWDWNWKNCMDIVGLGEGCYGPYKECAEGLRCHYEWKNYGKCRVKTA